ncbi:MAG TPA: DUF4407 domain-containing protein [Phnomibacter sp.]|nr:DUF4407 domain-containing protein [Phnomibacter sp.]
MELHTMQATEKSFPDGQPYSGMDALLWWLATAEPKLIKHFEVDKNRYRITGLIVLCTAVFAALAWTYFFSTTVANPLIYLPMGLFMGFVVLCIDRALIKGISKANKNKLGPLLLRGLLAVTIGLFMAQPAVLYLFDREVKMQVSLDNESRKQIKRQQLDSLYAGQKSVLLAERSKLENNLAARYNDMLTAQKNFLAETDGTGGSGKVGISTIALAKKKEFERLDASLADSRKQDQPKIDTINSQLNRLEQDIKQQEAQFAALLNHGFLTRIEAMQNLIDANKAVAFRYYLIVAILMLIELMPVIIKTMMPSGPYEMQVQTTDALNKEKLAHEAAIRRTLEADIEATTIESNRKTLQHTMELMDQGKMREAEAMVANWEKSDEFPIADWWNGVRKRLFGA